MTNLLTDLVPDLVRGCGLAEFSWSSVVDCCHSELYYCSLLKAHYSKFSILNREVVDRNPVTSPAPLLNNIA